MSVVKLYLCNVLISCNYISFVEIEIRTMILRTLHNLKVNVHTVVLMVLYGFVRKETPTITFLIIHVQVFVIELTDDLSFLNGPKSVLI